jgi:hypothetical protein
MSRKIFFRDNQYPDNPSVANSEQQQEMNNPNDVEDGYAETAVGNIASRRILEKVGFRHIGLHESEDDGLVDGWLLRD